MCEIHHFSLPNSYAYIILQVQYHSTRVIATNKPTSQLEPCRGWRREYPAFVSSVQVFQLTADRIAHLSPPHPISLQHLPLGPCSG